MQQVITTEQAKQITGKTKPLTIEQYERACELLQECTTIIQAKKWVDAASAYETIAKIKGDQRALRLSKALLYQAALACRAIAEGEAKGRRLRERNGAGKPPVIEVMKEHGFTLAEVEGTRVLKKVAERGGIERLLARSRPPGLTALASSRGVGGAQSNLGRTAGVGALLGQCVGLMRSQSPRAYMDGTRDKRLAVERLEFAAEWIATALKYAKSRYGDC